MTTLELVSLIEEKLASLFSEEDGLSDAARYALLAPAKRLRPLLTLATALDFGVSSEKALVPACALELVHTYSLIHDDLPCMDDDDFRRGKPSLHKAYTEGHAVLTGDFFLTYAFQLLSESPHLSTEQRLALIRTLSLRAGAHGMIGGQVADIAERDNPVSWETLQYIHFNKTAALITAALEFGGIIAEASPQEMSLLQTIGNHLGLAFQALDDIKDADEGFHNIISHLGLEKSHIYVDALLASMTASLNQLPRASRLLELTEHLFSFAEKAH